jgi:hypothetical protein
MFKSSIAEKYVASWVTWKGQTRLTPCTWSRGRCGKERASSRYRCKDLLEKLSVDEQHPLPSFAFGPCCCHHHLFRKYTCAVQYIATTWTIREFNGQRGKQFVFK